MTNPWISRLGGFLTLLLVVTGLALLQASGRGLLVCFPAYGLIAIAALIGFSTIRSGSRADFLSLCTSVSFCGYIAIRALTSPAPYIARTDLYSVLAALTLYGLTVTALSNSGRRMALIILLLTFAMFHVLVGLIQFGLGENFMVLPFLQTLQVGKRGSGLYGNPDHLAGLLEVLGIFGLSITCWSRLSRLSKVFVGYLTAICYFGLALTGSRGGYLSVAASLLVFLVLSLMVLRAGGASLFRRFGAIGFLAFTAALIAGGFLIQQSASLSERFGSIVATDNTRLDLWGASIEQWKLQLLTGTGSGTYRFYGRQFRAERMQNDPVDVHNDYLHLLCEYGLIGFIGFWLFFLAHLRSGWRTFDLLGPRRLAAGSLPLSSRLALNIGALSAIGAYAVHSAVDYNLHIPANALLLAFVFGVVANPGGQADSEVPRFGINLTPRLATAVLGAILLLQCVRLFPGEYYADRARIALWDEDPSTAVSFANKALAYEQGNPNIFFYLGRAQMALGNDKRPAEKRSSYYDVALTALDKARHLVPLDETYPLDMAFAYDQMGRFAEAEWMYSIARSLDPRSTNILQLYKTHLETWGNEGRENVSSKTDSAPSERN